METEVIIKGTLFVFVIPLFAVIATYKWIAWKLESRFWEREIDSYKRDLEHVMEERELLRDQLGSMESINRTLYFKMYGVPVDRQRKPKEKKTDGKK